MAEDEMTFKKVEKQFLQSMNEFGKQLEKLATDMQAMEIITAVGTTTLKFASDPQKPGSRIDITNLANSDDKTINGIEGKITILARTRFELDGDLLVILPTKNKTPQPQPTPPPSNPSTNPSASNTNQAFEIDTEILEYHKQNVNLALQNLQFIYGKTIELLTKISEGNKGFFGKL